MAAAAQELARERELELELELKPEPEPERELELKRELEPEREREREQEQRQSQSGRPSAVRPFLRLLPLRTERSDGGGYGEEISVQPPWNN